MDGRPRSWFDWFFRDRRTGRVVLVQRPNALLSVLVGTVLAWLVLRWAWNPSGAGKVVLDGLLWAGVLPWAFDEILRGVNPYRRVLGVASLIVTAIVWWIAS